MKDPPSLFLCYIKSASPKKKSIQEKEYYFNIFLKSFHCLLHTNLVRIYYCLLFKDVHDGAINYHQHGYSLLVYFRNMILSFYCLTLPLSRHVKSNRHVLFNLIKKCLMTLFNRHWGLPSPSPHSLPSLCSPLLSYNGCLSWLFTSPSCFHRGVSQPCRRLWANFLWLHHCIACMSTYSVSTYEH